MGVDRELLICPTGMPKLGSGKSAQGLLLVHHQLRAASPSWPGLTRPSTSYFCGAKNVDAREIGAKQSFVASPGHDEWNTLR
jgi:hypothetical protein